ncbi:uncharacterized protein LOC142329470 [Lycorma delicatula]|uniref:uncharacterized protein LOC142329470 n=1 Tax=Lycorma delicatula TaxID=130591 RepID=UPI003F5146CF
MPAFVDKSLLIKRIFQGVGAKLITAPRRFGKSTNLDMLRSFLSIPVDKYGDRTNQSYNESYKIFKKLKIYNDKKFFYKNYRMYPVIYIDLKADYPITRYEDVIEILGDKIHDSFSEHKYLIYSKKLNNEEKERCRQWCCEESFLKMSPREIKIGLKQLSKFLYKHFNNTKVFILIDEYDSIIMRALFKIDVKELENIVELVIGQISMLCKSNKYVERAVITGVSYIAGVGLSGLNNVKVYTFLYNHPFVEFYGFSETEVKNLFENPIIHLKNDTIRKAREWYNGYTSTKGRRIFNPFSILNFLQDGTISNYWIESGYIDRLTVLFKHPFIKKIIEKLLNRKNVSIDFHHRIELEDIINLRS